MLPILALLLAGATPDPAPLTASPAAADRGEVRSGPPLVQTFRLTNPSAAPIRITGVETGCGCVRRDLSRDVLPPGESADLTVTVNTLTQAAGPNAWRALVRYRAEAGQPTDHQLELTVRATVVREVTVTPPELAFSTAGAARQTLVVSDRRAKPLSVLRATCTGNVFTAEIGATTTADGVRSQEITVNVPTSAPAGDWTETLTLLTDDPGCPELKIPVRVSKRPADGVTATPARLDLRFAPGQTTLSRVVQLRAGGRTVAVGDAAGGHPAVRVTASPAGPVATVRVAVDRAAAGPGGRAEVRLTLTEPPGETVVVPVAWEAP